MNCQQSSLLQTGQQHVLTLFIAPDDMYVHMDPTEALPTIESSKMVFLYEMSARVNYLTEYKFYLSSL